MQKYEYKTIQIPNTEIPIEMVWVEKGTFQMGGGSSKNATPHRVQLDGFWIGKYPVTQAQWQAIVEQANHQNIAHSLKTNPSRFSGSPQRPVERVSWHDCMHLTFLLNEIMPSHHDIGKGIFRLPTEAEWEYAAKGGEKGALQNYTYAGSNDLEKVAWYDDNGLQSTQIVGLKVPNQLGIYDMSGNVFEWCLDEYHENTYQNTPDNFLNPVRFDDNIINIKSKIIKNDSITIYNKNRAKNSVLRGGSWYSLNNYCPVVFRRNYLPTYVNFNIGFRFCFSG